MASKAKKVHSVSISGDFDMGTMEIIEVTKEGEFVFDFKEILKEFDGKNIKISISEQNELPTKE